MDGDAGEDLGGDEDGQDADYAGRDEAEGRLDGREALVFLVAVRGVLAVSRAR